MIRLTPEMKQTVYNSLITEREELREMITSLKASNQALAAARHDETLKFVDEAIEIFKANEICMLGSTTELGEKGELS